jgi:predicted phage terminase large subunit-like protein
MSEKVPAKKDIALSILESGEFEKELIKQIHSDSYYEFFKQAYAVLLPGEPYSDNWHIKYLCDRLQQEFERIKRREIRQQDIIINIPFRSAKSLICTVVFPVWCWTQDQSTKFITTSYAAALALEHALASRSLITSEWFQNLYSGLIEFAEDQNAAGFYKIKGGGFRKSVGIGGQITGSGADIIIVDDPQNPKMAASEVERKTVKNFYDQTLYSRLNQPELGVRIVIMQRLAEEDLSGHLMDTSPEKHDHICIPVELDRNNMDKENLSPLSLLKHYDENGLYWPGRFSKANINDYISRLGSKEAAGQLYQRPAPKEGNMVKEAWFDVIDPTTLVRDLRYEPMMFFLDTAESDDQQANGDYSAMVVAYKKNNCIYVCNVVKVKKAFHELCKFIPVFVNENLYSQFSQIKVEPKSSGKSVVSQLRATTQLNISELPAPKDSKVTRLSSMTPAMESRRVKFLQGNYLKPFMDNLLVFPNGKHDDDVDAFIHCVEHLLGGNDFDFDFA